MELLLGTTNPAKIEELEIGLKPLTKKGIRILSTKDLKIKEDPVESGKDFKENAKIKAQFYGERTKLFTLADDGGLVIPALGGEPGVKSHRWLGYEASDDELIDYTLKRLRGFLKEERVAYLQTCLCFYDPKTKSFLCWEEKIKGHIAKRPSGNPTNGYPFRALFIVDEYNKYYDELSEEEHIRVNHRIRALKRLIPSIESFLNF